MMRLLLLPFVLLFCFHASGQNWALLNPAYKYNYSNDGSDTISNQIFVTHIDTLGVDSFRYELNRIGVVCDTCPESLGGPCDGCFVWVDQPQFLQRTAVTSSGEWIFMDPDTFLIRTDIEEGGTWVYSQQGPVIATVTAQISLDLFGIQDSLRTVVLSTGDTLLITKEHGLLRKARAQPGATFSLIGLQGLGAGTLLPDHTAYFDYQEGDVLQYTHAGSWHDNTGGMFDWHFFSGIQKIVITSRTEMDQGYHVSFASGVEYLNGPPPYVGAWPTYTLSGNIIFNDSTLFARFYPVFSYPNQIVSCDCGYFAPPSSSYTKCLVIHSTDETGKHVIRSFERSDEWGDNHGVLSYDPVPGYPQLFPFDGPTAYGTFREGEGMTRSGANTNFEAWCDLQLEASLLDGDTTGTIHPDQGLFGSLGLHARMNGDWISLAPNPATDELHITAQNPLEWWISSLDGSIHGSGQFSAASTRTIDVAKLNAGVYVLSGRTHQSSVSLRFMIAR